jgi:sugar O-acyltransferase (sialic acid O-acetyltransferase NeuD family)
MPALIPVVIPQIDPNDYDALLAGLHVRDQQLVHAGEVLATLETTKSTQELAADTDGYILGLAFSTGQTVRAGQNLCFIADSPDQPLPEPASPAPERQALPSNLRITQPALDLARSLSIDLSRLPLDRLVTAAVVRSLTHQDMTSVEAVMPADPASFDPQALIIYGGGGHGKSLIDLVRALPGFHLAGIVDDGLPEGSQVLGVPVLGGADRLAEQYAQGIRLGANAVGGIGNLAPRLVVFERLAQAGFTCPTVVHPAAYVEPSAQLSAGIQVFAHAYVGSAVSVGFGCIINTGAILSHDCTLEEYANLSPGAILAGGVRIGARSLVGMGVTINLGVKIGAGARIGNSATIKADVPEAGVVRAGSIWPA